MSEYLRSLVKKEYYKQPWDQIKFRTHFGVCIYDTLVQRGYTRTEDQDWHIFWSEKELVGSVFEKCRMQPHQRVNHFRNYHEVFNQLMQLCRKDNLSRNLKKQKKQLQKQGKLAEAKEYNFYPQTYHLPLQYGLFADEFKKATDKNIWIMKPTAKSQGKGIFLFNRIGAIQAWSEAQSEPYICQKYISDPLLIGGKKFDLRLYVLVTSYHPLTVYLNRSGFARFTHYRYDQSKINNTEIHLTNVAIQKMTEQYNPELGGKWLVDKLRIYLLSKYGSKPVEDCFYSIQSLIIKTLKSVQKHMSNDKHCFELYGFDIMLDAAVRPWIIEVNGSPSMRANTPKDCILKCGLIDDVLTIVDIEGILTGDEQQVGGFDLIYKNDSERVSPLGPGTSRLGCLNNRIEAIKRLAKQIENRAIKESQTSKSKDKSFDAGNKKPDDKRRSSTIGKTPHRQGSIVRPPPILPPTQQNLKQILKTNETEPKSATSMNHSTTSKNWIIRKNNSIKKESTPQHVKKQIVDSVNQIKVPGVPLPTPIHQL